LRRFFRVGGTLPPVCLSTSELPFGITSQTRDSFLQVFAGKRSRYESLARPALLEHIFGVNVPDLDALKAGDARAWDDAFAWLWPVVFGVAKLKLQPYLPNEIEDVAIESLERLVKKVPQVKSAEELKPLAASIAQYRAVSLLRERFAKKRGEGKTDSLDAEPDGGVSQNELASGHSPLDDLEQKELAQRIRQSLTKLKPPMGEILSDFFLDGLSYEEIAKKRGIAVGSVGVYLKRGLEMLRRIWFRDEKQLK
jgi:RNA polymerase sigma factor (sigma-70 family)